MTELAVVSVAELTEPVREKLRALESRLADLDRVVVAYSGGVDSAFLAKVAHGVLGDRAIAVTARSASLMTDELDRAVRVAAEIGIAHRIVETHELARPDYTRNDLSRCYSCKDELFDVTASIAGAFDGIVVDGFNADDLVDHRPGHRAALEHGVRHPLADVGLEKAEIRALSKDLGLSTWSKPQLACLSSRLPYGMEVTLDRLGRVELVEVALRRLGFFDVRARLVKDNDDMVRIEVGEAEVVRVVEGGIRSRILAVAKEAGFRFVTVDLEGFRSGRLNEGLIQLERPGVGRSSA